MEPNTPLLCEMRVLNELRKLKPEQRKELIETLEREEKLEEEALKKNPNLHVENKLGQLLNELKDLRSEVHVIKNRQCTMLSNSQGMMGTCNLDDRYQCRLITNAPTPAIEEESIPDCGECSLLSIDWWPIIMFVFIFLAIFSIPSNKSVRPCPISI